MSLGIKFHRQVPILDYIVDFYSHEIGLVIELDGSSHDAKFREDSKRQGQIEQYGVQFLRFSNEEIHLDLDIVLECIAAFVKEALR